MRVHLSGEVQDEMETSESENRTYFDDICNKLTLELLPLYASGMTSSTRWLSKRTSALEMGVTGKRD
jgi:hypothetical protein